MPPPHGEAAGKGPKVSPGGTLSTVAKLAWPGVTALEAWLHQSMGARPGPRLGVPQGRAWFLQCHGGWGGREGLAGSAPHTSASAPSGLLFKARYWGNKTMWLK